jgi:hypothetical protein
MEGPEVDDYRYSGQGCYEDGEMQELEKVGGGWRPRAKAKVGL